MDKGGKLAWYCLRTQLKHEHIAAQHLRQFGLETFLPRISFQRGTALGRKWVTEALFPSYLFARFSLETSLRLVHHLPGVSAIVHFGPLWPSIPEAEIDTLRRVIPGDAVHVISADLASGHEIRVTSGVFQGLRAVVTRIMPGHERVRILLEFLGRQTEAELPCGNVIRTADPRTIIEAVSRRA